MVNFSKQIRALATGLFHIGIATGALSAQAPLLVPQQYSSIQGAINASRGGDTVLVAPGTYHEHIDFAGRAIVVRASGSAAETTIDGSGFPVAPVVSFRSGETRASVLEGLTIQGGSPESSSESAGGILVLNSAPTLVGNRIVHNYGCGIGSYYSSALIENNAIQATQGASGLSACGLFGAAIGGRPAQYYSIQGTGLFLYGMAQSPTPTAISGNEISNNTGLAESVAGVELVDAGPVTIIGNAIHDNLSHFAMGSAIGVGGDSEPTIIQNVIYDNAIDASHIINPAPQDAGAGINIAGITEEEGFRGLPIAITNNTLVNNVVIAAGVNDEGAQIYLTPPYSNLVITNNILSGSGGSSSLFCEVGASDTAPSLSFNDTFSSAGGLGFGGTCRGLENSGNNVALNPLFSPAHTLPSALAFQLIKASPAVDAGDNSAPNVPPEDFLGMPRIQNAKGGPKAIVDLGAFEYQGAPVQPVAATFSLSSSTRALTLDSSGRGQLTLVLIPSSNFNSLVSLTCSGLPRNTSCGFATNMVKLAGPFDDDVALSFTRTDPSGGMESPEALIKVSLFALLPFGLLWKRCRGPICLLAVLGSLVFMSACGVHLNKQSNDGIATIEVTATSQSGESHSLLIAVGEAQMNGQTSQ